MSEHSPIHGKTPYQAERFISAQQRQQVRATRSNEDQLALLDSRPGASKRERKRLTCD